MIDADKATYAIAWMCRMLGVPLLQPVAATSPVRIERIFTDSRSAYGCRRIAAELNRDGCPAIVGLVADLMRELGLRACQSRAYKRTTVPGDEPVTSPDLLARDFTAPEPGQRWSATSPTCAPVRAGSTWPR